MATLRCVVKGKERLLEVKGIGDSKDSRQRLELLAVLEGLKHMIKPSEITIKAAAISKQVSSIYQPGKRQIRKRANGNQSPMQICGSRWQRQRRFTK